MSVLFSIPDQASFADSICRLQTYKNQERIDSVKSALVKYIFTRVSFAKSLPNFTNPFIVEAPNFYNL